MTRQSGETREHLTGGRGVEWWIASLRDSRASRSAQQESDLASETLEMDRFRQWLQQFGGCLEEDER